MVTVKGVKVQIIAQNDNGTTKIIKCIHTNINVQYTHILE